ncbi:hypothetical protein BH11ACT1_BH11ACT1_02910 [soil metagenome]
MPPSRCFKVRCAALPVGSPARTTPKEIRKAATDTVREIAHQPSVAWLEEADIDRVFTVTESLCWLSRLVLLDQAGLDPELITDKFQASQSYSVFLSNAAEWQPVIYPKTSDGT